MVSCLDSSTVAVKDHLRSLGFALTPSTLDIQSHHGQGCIVTTVRIADRTGVWTQEFVDHLTSSLRDLPGHPYVRLSDIRDLVDVVWDGVARQK